MSPRTHHPDQSDRINAAGSDLFDRTRMSFGDHLEELRRCLIQALLGVVAATIITLIFGKAILSILFRPLLAVQLANGMQPSLQALSPTTAFAAYVKIGFLSGIVLSFPWMGYQLWKFVAVGLYAHERRFARLLVLPSTALFALGVVFLYFIVLPVVLQFFISFNRKFNMPDLNPSIVRRMFLEHHDPAATAEVEPPIYPNVPLLPDDPEEMEIGASWINMSTLRFNVQTPLGTLSGPLELTSNRSPVHSWFALDDYISFVLLLALAFGIAFETPVVVFFLALTGIVTTGEMRKARRYVILGAVILGAVLTPPDPVSQLLLAFPMYLLFEAGLFFGRWVEKNRGA